MYSWNQAGAIVFLTPGIDEGASPPRKLILAAVGGFPGQMLRNAFTL